MRTAIIFAALLAVAFAISAEEEFQSWRVANHKFYSTAAEYHKRLAIFSSNSKYIAEENTKGHSYELGLNYFADLTHEEFVALYTAYMPEDNSEAEMHVVSGVTKDIVDWREEGIVNKVKDQGQCGSCYAFGGMAGIEAVYAQAEHLENFAEQEIVDCDTYTGNQGCNGGWQYWTMKYVIDKGICKTSEYPYTARKGTCQNKSCTKTFPIKSYKQVAADENQMANAASKTVLSIAVYVTQNFQLYKSGVLDDAKCTGYYNVNHAVSAVGYGTDDASGKDYWIVRNSWGTSWGMNGYILMVRGSNKCKIASYVYYAEH